MHGIFHFELDMARRLQVVRTLSQRIHTVVRAIPAAGEGAWAEPVRPHRVFVANRRRGHSFWQFYESVDRTYRWPLAAANKTASESERRADTRFTANDR